MLEGCRITVGLVTIARLPFVLQDVPLLAHHSLHAHLSLALVELRMPVASGTASVAQGRKTQPAASSPHHTHRYSWYWNYSSAVVASSITHRACTTRCRRPSRTSSVRAS